MAVKIRLAQTGKRNRRQFRVVVVDESKKRDGKFVELVGHLNPGGKPGLVLKKDRIDHWLKLGATPTDSVKKLLQTA